jgi:hypothetical protein
MQHYIGIDVAKKTLDVCIPGCRGQTLSNNLAGYQNLLKIGKE